MQLKSHPSTHTNYTPPTKHNYSFYLPAALLSLTAISGILLSSTTVFADNDTVVDQINVTVPVSCTMSGIGMNSHNADVANGIYRTDIGSTTLKIFCNDNEGFVIYAAGYTGNEIGATNSNKLVGNPSSIGNISTGIATSGDTSNWAMKLTATADSGDTVTNPLTIDSAPNTTGGADASFSSYHAVPLDLTRVAHKNSATDMDTTNGGATLTTTYAFYANATQPAGTYSGQVIYTLIHPATAPAPVNCNPNATTIAAAKCLQDFGNNTPTNRVAIATSMTPEQQYTLKDSRDGKSYTIAKYQVETDPITDDPVYEVYMTKNLDLDLLSTKTYTNLDTDIGYDSETETYNTATWTPTVSTYTTEGIWYVDANLPESYDPGNIYVDMDYYDNEYWAGAYIESCEGGSCDASLYALLPTDWKTFIDSCNGTFEGCNMSLMPTPNETTGIPQYHAGNYYNWSAATAMNSDSTWSSSGRSICPAGWALPSAAELLALGEAYNIIDYSYEVDSNDNRIINGNTLWKSPLFLTTDWYYNERIVEYGAMGYWSFDTIIGRNSHSFMYFDTYGSIGANSNEQTYNGHAVRCKLRVPYNEPIQ